MSVRSSIGLGMVALVGAAASFFMWSGHSTSLETGVQKLRKNEVAPPLAGEHAHPLDPLSQEEITAAIQVLRDQDRLHEQAFFPDVVLHEPPKDEVLQFRKGGPMRREAFVVALDRQANKTYEAVVDLKARKTIAWTEVPGVHPAVLLEEYNSAADIVRADPGWLEAMRKRGIKDTHKVQLDAWAPGPVDPGHKGARVVRVLSYYRGDAINAYARPIEGIVATVNMNSRKVIDLVDRAGPPTPADSSDFFDTKIAPPRPALKPLVIQQPQGNNFEVRGNEVRWQNWVFRYALHPREGLILHTVGYQDNGRTRPILYRAAVSEMIVPYADPDGAWNWRSAFDQGEYGMGQASNPLRLGLEVPENAMLLPTVMADDSGKAIVYKDLVALYEQDSGILWTHTDFESQRTETRRGRQAVLQHLFTIGNYDYGMKWIFHQDGVLELQAELSGILLAKGVQAEQCEVCKQKPGPDGTLTGTGADRYGKFIARNLVAPNHQHFFCFRLDFDVDGPNNSVTELNVVPEAPLPDNPVQNAFLVEQKLLRSEREARRNLNFESHRAWKVWNPNRTNALGHFPAYKLEPGGNAVPYAQPEAVLRKRALFLNHHVWVTRAKQNEIHAAGYYPNQAAGGEGLPRWAGDNEAIVNEDIVLWYTMGVTHIPRAEDWPVMPTARTGFRLLPDGFFTRNPALDVPGRRE